MFALAGIAQRSPRAMYALGRRALAGMHGMGPRTLAQLEDALDEHGLELPAG